MSDPDQRAVLERLIRERGDDYANLSRLIGRNVAYVQQFIRRGVPRKLSEADRIKLARYFNVSPEDLGAPSDAGWSVALSTRTTAVPVMRIEASAGAGATASEDRETSHVSFDDKWLRHISTSKPSDLSLIKVQGDSMWPTLSDGDDIFVDSGDGRERLRDGIYVLRRDEALLVKRLALSPAAHRISIRSDNSAYPDWPDCKICEVNIIGRVVWAGRRIS